MGKMLYTSVGFKEVQTVEVEGYKEHPKSMILRIGVYDRSAESGKSFIMKTLYGYLSVLRVGQKRKSTALERPGVHVGGYLPYSHFKLQVSVVPWDPMHNRFAIEEMHAFGSTSCSHFQ